MKKVLLIIVLLLVLAQPVSAVNQFMEDDGPILTSSENTFEPGTYLLIGLAVGLVVALIVTGMWKRQLKSVRPKAAAADYVVPGSLRLTDKRDKFLYSTVTKVKRQQSSSSGSSSGRSHSGGVGRF